MNDLLKKVFVSLGRDKLIDIGIAAIEALKELDLKKDSNKDELAFDFLIQLLEGLK